MTEVTTLECQSCGAALQVHATEMTSRCLYCASPQVIRRPSDSSMQPTFALGFVVEEDRARDIASQWKKAAYFAPSAFREARIEEIRGLYAPVYIYSAEVRSEYSAMIGEDYTVTETYQTTDSEGNSVTRTRTKTETEWLPLTGAHTCFVDNRVISASKGIPNDQLEAIEPYDMRALHRYTAKSVSGWSAEEPTQDDDACLAMAREEGRQQVAGKLSKLMPGDRVKGFKASHSTKYEDLVLTLLPIWVLPIRYADDQEPVRLLVNGQTGKLIGKPPKSWFKIVSLIVFVLLALAALVFFLMRRFS